MNLFDRIKLKALGLIQKDLNPRVAGNQSISGAAQYMARPESLPSYSFARAPETFENIGLGRTAGQVLRGASTLTIPGVMNPTMLSGQNIRSAYDMNAPQTQAENIAFRGGRYGMGTALTAPLTGATSMMSLLSSAGRNAVTGTALGGIFGAGGDIVQGQMPTMQSIGQGAVSGAENSWMFPATNAMTNQIFTQGSKVLPFLGNYTDDALSASNPGLRNGLSKIPAYLARTTAREATETPLESTAFGMQELAQPGETRGLPEIVSDRFKGDLLGNILFGAGRGSLSLAKPPKVDIKTEEPEIDDLAVERRIFKNEIEDLRRRGVPEEEIDEMLRTNKQEEEVISEEELEQYIADVRKFRQIDEEIEQAAEQRNKVYTPEMKGSVPEPEVTEKDYLYAVRRGISPKEFQDMLTSMGRDGAMVEASKLPELPPEIALEAYRGNRAEVQSKEIPDDQLAMRALNSYRGYKPQPQYGRTKTNEELAMEQVKMAKQQEARKQKITTEAVKTTAPVSEDPGYIESLTQEKPQEIGSDKPFVSTPKSPASEPKPVEEILRPDITKVPLSDLPNQIKSDQDRVMVNQELDRRLNKLESSLKGRTIGNVLEDREAGVKDEATEIVGKWFDTFKEIAERSGKKIGTIEDFVTHITPQKADDIIQNGMKPDTAGSILGGDVYFGKSRTGKLTDYVMDKRTMLAYAIEAMKNEGLSDVQKQEIKVMNEIKNKVSESEESSITGSDDIDFVKMLEDLASPEVQKTQYFGGDKKGLSRSEGLVRSVDDRTFAVKDKKFYDDFLFPFHQARIKISAYAKELEGLTDEELKNSLRLVPGAKPQDMSRTELIARMVAAESKNQREIAIDTYTRNVENAQFKETWLIDLVNDIGNEYVVKEIRKQSKAVKAMAGVRRLTGMATLGLNVASTINNIFEIRRGVSAVSTKDMLKALKRVGAGEDLGAEYGVDSVYSTALERMKSDQGWRGTLKSAEKGLYVLFDKSETLKDRILLAGFEEQGKTKGFQGDDLTKYVLRKYSQFAIKYGKGQDVGLYKSPLVKTLFQFGQYALKDLVLTGDKTKGALSGDVGDMKYMTKYVATTIAQAMLFKQIMGTIGFGGQTGTPWDLFTELTDEQNLAPGNKQIPFTSPIVQSFATIAQMMADEARGVERDEYDEVQRQKALKRSIASATVPTSNQLLFKTGGAIQAQQKGYQEKFGGNIANPVSDDIPTQIKTLLFGQSYDPQRQEAIDDYTSGRPYGLNDKQSALFKTLPREQQQAFYDQQMSKNDAQDQNQKVIDGITEEPKQTFLQRILGGKEEESQIVWGIKPTTAEEKKNHKALVTTALDNGIEVPAEDLRTALFNGKTFDSTSLKDQGDVMKVVKSSMENEFYTDEQKQAILEASGVPKKVWNFYELASKSEGEQLQAFLPLVGDLSKPENFQKLMLYRAKVAGQQGLQDGMVSYLYDRGYIDKDQKKILQALKYDEINKEFYFTRSYTEGSGGKKLSYAQALKLFKPIEFPKPIKVSSIKDLATKLPTTNDGGEQLLQNILSAPKRTTNKGLWFN